MKKKTTAFLVFVPLIFLAACGMQGEKKKDATAKQAITTNDNPWENLLRQPLPWHSYGKPSLGKAWQLEDSVLHLNASVKNGWQTKEGGDIVSDSAYQNFNLKLEWKISEAGNSGIMFYVKEDTAKYKYPWETGPEMQVADNEKNEDGKVEKAHAGDLYDLMSISKNTIKPAGQWNAVEIIANNSRLQFLINHEKVLETTMWDDAWQKKIAATKFNTMPGFGTFKKGHIALQDHGSDVWFRNIMIKKL